MYMSTKLNGLKARKHQSGAALMELMVGITIGLLVVVAAVGSLVYTRTASTTMVDSTRLQQKADGFFRLIKFQLPQAGGMAFTPQTAAAVLASGDFRVSFDQAYQGYYDTSQTGGTPLLSVHGSDGGGAVADTLRISTQDDKTSTIAASYLRDCTGARPPPALDGISINNMYSVNANLQLICTVPTVAGVNPQPVLDGVEDFQVIYGVLTGGNTYQYYRADQVPSWPTVTTVALCLRLRGDLAGNPRPTGASNLIGCDGLPVAAATMADGRIRRVYTRTFSLRNALP